MEREVIGWLWDIPGQSGTTMGGREAVKWEQIPQKVTTCDSHNRVVGCSDGGLFKLLFLSQRAPPDIWIFCRADKVIFESHCSLEVCIFTAVL